MVYGRIKDNKILQPMNQQTWNNRQTSKTITTTILGYNQEDAPVMNERVTTLVMPDFWTQTSSDIELFTTHTPATTVEQNIERTTTGKTVAHGIKLNKYQYPGVNQGMITLNHQTFIDYNYSPVYLHIIVQQGAYFKTSFFNDDIVEVTGEESGATYTELCYDLQQHKLYINGEDAGISTSRTRDDITFYINMQGLVIYDVYLDTKKSLNPSTISLTDIDEGTILINPNNVIYPEGNTSYPIVTLEATKDDNLGKKILKIYPDDELQILNIYDGYIYYKQQKSNEYQVKSFKQNQYDDIKIKLIDNLELVTIQYTPLLLKFPQEIMTETIPIENIISTENMIQYPPNEGIRVVTSDSGLYAYKYDTPIDTTINQEITVYANSTNPTTLQVGLGNLGRSVTDQYDGDPWIQGIYDDSEVYNDFTRYNPSGESHTYTMKIYNGTITLYHDDVPVNDVDPYTPAPDEDMYLILITKPDTLNIHIVQTIKAELDPNETYKPVDQNMTYLSFDALDVTNDYTIIISFRSIINDDIGVILAGIGTYSPRYDYSWSGGRFGIYLTDVDVDGFRFDMYSDEMPEVFDGETHTLKFVIANGEVTVYVDGVTSEDEYYHGTVSDSSDVQNILVVLDEKYTVIDSISCRED